jgi:HlyD family secretion protein
VADHLPLNTGTPRALPPRPELATPASWERMSASRRRKYLWPLIGLIAATGFVAAIFFSPRSTPPNDSRLTHTISRGDLIVTITEKGTLESAENLEIKCQARGGEIPVLWVIENGTLVQPGDVLVRLGTLEFEDRVSEVSKWAHMTRSEEERARADVAKSELAIREYLEGRYESELMTLEKDLAVIESSLRTARNTQDYINSMADRGYVSELDVEEAQFAVRRAELNVEVKRSQIAALKDYTKAMELETLQGNLKASKARYEAAKQRRKQLETQLELCRADVEHCVVKAEQSGMVIHPSAARWRNAPEIRQGGTVYTGQSLLLFPDLSQMQVKVGVRESVVDRVQVGLTAKVTLPDQVLEGHVASVATVTAPAGWWTANVARYDTIIELPKVDGLKPGMSAEVEVVVDRHEDVIQIPVAAVVSVSEGDFCWVQTPHGGQRRSLTLGDTNNVFTVVRDGLQEGERIFLNPLAFQEARTLLQEMQQEENSPDDESLKSDNQTKPQETRDAQPTGES